MENSRLHIRRFRAEYLVPNDHLAPESIKGRLDEAFARHLLGQTLSAALSSWFSEADKSVWIVRRLDLDFAVNVSWEREQLTKVIATEIARTLGATLQSREANENVLWFPNRAAYLARFLVDLAEGGAWSRWYYESFAGLKLLPASVALRTAICDSPDTGEAALLELANHELKTVLRVLTSQDARRILDELTQNKTTGSEFHCCDAAWAVWRVTEADSFASSDASRQLQLYLAARRNQPDVGGQPLKRAAAALLRLASRLAADSPGQRQQLIASLAAGEAVSVYETAGADAEALMPLLRCPPEWVREVSEALSSQHTAAASETAATSGRRDTTFGGAFLLLPLLDELPLAQATRDWPPAGEAAAITLARFLLLVKCCGQSNAQRAFYDPLLRDLLLIPPGISPAVIREWSLSIAAAQLRTFLESLLNWQRSHGAVQGKTEVLASANLRGRLVALLIDGSRGHWLSAQRYSPRRPQRLIAALRNPLAQLEHDDGLLLCEPSLLPTLWSAFPGLRMMSTADELAQTGADEANQISGIVARLEKLPDDLSYVALADSFQLPRVLDLAFSVGAQHLLRDFAWRLPGFAESKLPYLAANFLDFTGSIEAEPDYRVVRLGRPPLHLVLNLTGMLRGSYRLSWLDERPFVLTQE